MPESGVRSCEHFLFSVIYTFGDMWLYYLPCSRFQSDSLTLGWVTCCLRIEIAVVTLWISVASTISASPSPPSFNASLPCSISTAADMSQVWHQTHFGFFASRAAAEPYDGVIKGGWGWRGRFAFLHIFGMKKHMEELECV